ncbi:transglycosylase SLT domain-containing protein [Streptomyces sp. NPDC050560]|uniref:transglycosylase SLT domain-containing protein n=1 Tax=Streptomyces sp. NPDC050560 TaxID=3365630 RepID=UPI0037B74C1D
MPGNTFDAGSIESRLVLDRSDFTQGLREARTEGERFESRTFKAKVALDRTEFTRDLAGLRTQLATLRDVRLNVGVSGSSGQIQQIRQQMSSLRGADLGVRVNGVTEASAQLRTLRQQVNALDGRTININANFDGAAALAQIAALRAALAGLDGQTTRTRTNLNALQGSGDLAGKAMGALMASAVLAAPALIPLSAAALNVAGSFAAMTTTVGVGLGLFTAATVGAVKQVTNLDKEVEKAKTNLAQQREVLGRLTPGTDAYAQQLKKCEDAQQALNKAQAAYTPQQRAFSTAMDGMKKAWQGFVDSTSSTTLPIASTFVRTVSSALPKAVPAVKAMAPEVKAIADDVQRWVKGGGLDRFFQNVIKFGVPAFRDLRLAAKDVFSVLGSGFRAFLPQSVSLAASLRQGAASLRAWADGGGFQRFLAYVRQNAPQVREFFHTLGAALKNVFDAMKGLGPLGLGFVTLLLKIVAALPVPVLQGMILAWTAWKFAILGVALAARAMLIFNAVRTAILGVRSAMFLLSIAFGMSPIGWLVIGIGLLVAAVVLIGLKMGWLQKAWKAAWEGIKFAAVWVWENALKPAWNGIKTGLDAIGKAAMWLWTNGIRPAFNFISVAARLLVVILGTVLFTPLYLAFKLLRTVAMALWNNGLKQVFGWIVQGAKLWWAGVKIYFNFLISIIKTLAGWGKWLWTNAFKPVFGWIVAGAKLWWNGVKIYFRFIWEGLQTVGKWGKWLWNNALKPAWDKIKDGTSWLYTKGIKPPINLIVGIFKTLGGWAKWLWQKAISPFWDKIKDGTSKLKDGMIKVFDKMKDGIGKVWTAIKKIAAVPINFVIDTVYNGGIVKVWNKIAGAVGLDKMKLGTVNKIKYDRGGRVNGGGGLSGLDSVAIQANPNEHIWTADEVKNFGGHGAMAAFRAGFSGNGKARVAPGAGTMDFARGSGQKYIWGGGVIDWTKDKLGDAAGGLKDAWDATGGKVVSKAWDAIKDVTRGAIGTVANPILKGIRSGVAKGVGGVIPGKPAWEDLAIGTATKPINMILDWIAKDDATHSVGGANVGKALDWAKSQEGKPYIWGGVGPKGYDCSGFMSAIQNVIDGKSPYTRRWATGAFPPGAKGWKRNEKDPFMVGITNAGVGHTAGTLGGVNVESRGGKGVIVGSGARGAGSSLFTSQWGYTPSKGGSGSGRWAETVTAVLRELGMYSTGNLSNVLKAIQKESGGNPNAVNNWDSNAKAGNPSKGLLQVIRTTFNAYAGKYKSKGQLDPYANIYAAVRYAKAAYGAGWSARMARPGGYKLGGVTMPGLHMVGEAGPELIATSGNDRVFTASETQQMLRRAGGAGGGVLTGSLELSGPVTLTVDGEQFDAHLEGQARATVATMVREAEGSR